MATRIIEPLDAALRALREVQAPQQVSEAPDRASGYRLSSAAFMPGRDGSVSVDLEESLLRAGLPITARYPAMARAVALVGHSVGAFRAQGMTVDHVPIPANEHHGEVRMAGLTRGQIRNAARILADSCEVIVPIEAAEVRKLGGLAE